MAETCKWCRGTGVVPVSKGDDPNCSVCGESLGAGPRGMIHALCLMPAQYMQHTVAASNEIASLRLSLAAAERERDRLNAAVLALQEGRAGAEAALEEALRVLTEVEWGDLDWENGDPWAACCPCCHERRDRHASDCALASAIGREGGDRG